MIETIEYQNSWIKFQDCIEGMRELPGNSIDLCLTDPPFNIGFKGKSYGGEAYEDNKDRTEYIMWCKEWFGEAKRITTRQIIFCGNSNIGYWCKYIEIPRDIAIWYKKNYQGRGSGYYLSKHEAILIYGKFKKDVKKLSVSVLEQNVEYEPVSQHPCPSNPKLYSRIISEVKAKSVLDPFMGSGTTAEASIINGIPFFGFEFETMFRGDIEKRISNGKRHKKSDSLYKYMI